MFIAKVWRNMPKWTLKDALFTYKYLVFSRSCPQRAILAKMGILQNNLYKVAVFFFILRHSESWLNIRSNNDI